MTVPVHYIGSWLGAWKPRGRTACKIECWKSEWSNEADTATNDRIDYSEVWKGVTCASCLKKRPYSTRWR